MKLILMAVASLALNVTLWAKVMTVWKQQQHMELVERRRVGKDDDGAGEDQA